MNVRSFFALLCALIVFPIFALACNNPVDDDNPPDDDSLPDDDSAPPDDDDDNDDNNDDNDNDDDDDNNDDNDDDDNDNNNDDDDDNNDDNDNDDNDDDDDDTVVDDDTIAVEPEEIDVAGFGPVNLAIGPDDVPHVSYVKTDYLAQYPMTFHYITSLWYATNEGEKAWSGEVVSAGDWYLEEYTGGYFWHWNSVGAYHSLALDASGQPRLVYHVDSEGDTYDHTFGHDYWYVGQLIYYDLDSGFLLDCDGDWFGAQDTGMFNRLAVDPGGVAHVFYHKWDGSDTNNDDLAYLNTDEMTPVILDHLPGGLAGAIDSVGRARVMYQDILPISALQYGWEEDGGWVFASVPSQAPGWDPFFAMALDADDHTHYTLLGDDELSIIYVNDVAGSWHVQRLMPAATLNTNYRAGTSSLAVDAEGQVHVAYQDVATGRLRYLTNAGGGWADYAIGDQVDVGQYSALAFDSERRLHIVYTSKTAGEYNSPLWHAIITPSRRGN